MKYDPIVEVTTDLVDRLRDKAHCNDWFMRLEAADEIEKLRAEIDRLRRAAMQHYGLR